MYTLLKKKHNLCTEFPCIIRHWITHTRKYFNAFKCIHALFNILVHA